MVNICYKLANYYLIMPYKIQMYRQACVTKEILFWSVFVLLLNEQNKQGIYLVSQSYIKVWIAITIRAEPDWCWFVQTMDCALIVTAMVILYSSCGAESFCPPIAELCEISRNTAVHFNFEVTSNFSDMICIYATNITWIYSTSDIKHI